MRTLFIVGAVGVLVYRHRLAASVRSLQVDWAMVCQLEADAKAHGYL